MINIINLQRQHTAIFEEIDIILAKIAQPNIEEKLSDITMHINKLAGLLNMHLKTEDEYLYPTLQKNEDEEIKEMGFGYYNEMGGLVGIFNEYKNRFNTPSKVRAEMKAFIPETKTIMSHILKRIQKEDTHLYKIIMEKQL